MAELSNCPFCGGKARVFESRHTCFRETPLTTPGVKADRFRITCIDCKSFGPSEIDRDTAIGKWNKRVLFPIGRTDGVGAGLN